MSTRPRLTPAIADVRRAVRDCLEALRPEKGADAAPDPLLLVALSGGPDSLALAAATAFEAPRAGFRAGAVVVDHGLQAGSAEVARRAADRARVLGLDPVLVRTVSVDGEGGPEAAAREARYAALGEAATEAGAIAVLLGHTLDDQAETVLLGLARGSGLASLSGMAQRSSGLAQRSSGLAQRSSGLAQRTKGETTYLRPLLGIRRETTVQFCKDSRLEPWIDPHNSQQRFARVRVRELVLPMLEAELGPGVTEALARTAELAREDSEALDLFAAEQAEELAEHAEAGLSLSVPGLANNPTALRQRIIRLAVKSEFGVSLSRAHTLEVARLVTDWRGQGPLDLPGIRVVRRGARIEFRAQSEPIG